MSDKQIILSKNPEWDETLGIWKNSKAAGSDILPNPLWIFGYGSLCYSPGDIKFTESKTGFWQKSCDHRGTAENPGLVCTLLSDDDWKKYGDHYGCGIVYGKAYKIDDKDKEDVLNELDYREKGGYTRILIDVYFEEEGQQPQVVQAILYKGHVDNPNFLYDESIRNRIQKQAEVIKKSIGPSGKNIEYFKNFYKFLNEIKQVDRYMEELAQLTIDDYPINN